MVASKRTRLCLRGRECVRASTPRLRGRGSTWVLARGDPQTRGRGFYRVRGVNADAGGCPEDVRGRPNKKDIQTVIFIQKRLL
jgi:hypothetical protein